MAYPSSSSSSGQYQTAYPASYTHPADAYPPSRGHPSSSYPSTYARERTYSHETYPDDRDRHRSRAYSNGALDREREREREREVERPRRVIRDMVPTPSLAGGEDVWNDALRDYQKQREIEAGEIAKLAEYYLYGGLEVSHPLISTTVGQAADDRTRRPEHDRTGPVMRGRRAAKRHRATTSRTISSPLLREKANAQRKSRASRGRRRARAKRPLSTRRSSISSKATTSLPRPSAAAPRPPPTHSTRTPPSANRLFARLALPSLRSSRRSRIRTRI
jgi:hypothetical protein